MPPPRPAFASVHSFPHERGGFGFANLLTTVTLLSDNAFWMETSCFLGMVVDDLVLFFESIFVHHPSHAVMVLKLIDGWSADAFLFVNVCEHQVSQCFESHIISEISNWKFFSGGVCFHESTHFVNGTCQSINVAQLDVEASRSRVLCLNFDLFATFHSDCEPSF